MQSMCDLSNVELGEMLLNLGRHISHCSVSQLGAALVEGRDRLPEPGKAIERLRHAKGAFYVEAQEWNESDSEQALEWYERSNLAGQLATELQRRVKGVA